MPGVRSLFPLLLLVVTLVGGGCREDGDIKVSSLTFNGVEQVDENALKSVLRTRQSSRLPWGRSRFFDRTAFEADLKRIAAFYLDRGFPDARVAAFDASLNDAQDAVDVTVTIVEGQPIRVATVELAGFDGLPLDEQVALRETLPLRAGQPLDRQLAIASRERALNVLRDHGYPYAAVTIAEEETQPKQRRVTLQAEPGTLARFGAIEVVGAVSVSEDVIRRQLTFEPGDPFSRREMRESQRRLYSMELFEFANVESQEDRDTRPADVPIRITVAEGKQQKVTVGVGYGTEEQARARLRWDHLNFLGTARHAGVEGKWSSLDRGVRADYREPYFLHRDFSLNFEGQAWQAAEPLYSLNSLGGRTTLRHQANLQNFWAVSLINEYQRQNISPAALLDLSIRDDLIALGLDPRGNIATGTLSAVAFDISRNTSNNLLDASSGYVVNAHAERAGRWLRGTFNYWSLSAEGRHYVSLGRRVVVANRLRVGAIDGEGDLNLSVPFYKRYFLGGSSSIRGWGRQEVGPTSGFGLPLGGHSMLEASAEARVPLFGKFGAVAFLDYGNVWTQPWDINLNDLRYAVGTGLRYMTPIGPARLDVGYQLTPIPNLRVNGEPERRHWRLHFSVGQAF